MEQREIVGLWWVPSQPTDQVGGTLSISATGDMSLQLNGYFATPPTGAGQGHPIIHGHSNDAGEISLLNSWLTRHSFHFPGYPEVSYKPEKALIGVRVTDVAPPIEAVVLRLSGLLQWSELSGLSVDVQRDRTAVEFEDPEPIVAADLATDTEVSLDLMSRLDGALPESRRLTQKAYFKLTRSLEAPFDQCLSWVAHLRALLTFAMAAPADIEHIGVRPSREPRDDSRFVELVMAYQQPTDLRNHVPAADQMFFTMGDIRSQWEQLLNAWFKFSRENSHVANILSGLQYGPPAHLETRNLLLAIVCEGYHRLLPGGDEPPPEEAQRRAEVLAACPEQYRPWLDNLLQDPQLPMRRRLKELVDSAQPAIRHLLTNNEARGRFVYRLSTFRNKFAHGARAAGTVSLTGERLYLQAQTAEWLARVCVAQQQLGLSADLCDGLLGRNRDVRHIREFEG